MSGEALLEARQLRKEFLVGRGLRRRRARVRAVDGVDVVINAGETVGLVGESGCGKTTLARTILRLEEPTSGQVLFRGEDLLALGREEVRKRRRWLQFVSQDGSESLNPRRRIGQSLREPLAIHDIVARQDRDNEVRRLLESVGLPAEFAQRYPTRVSGGERQLVAIARALASRPLLVVADEPVTALDPSTRNGVLALLETLVGDRGLAMLLIGHDLAVVERISDRVAIMYSGRLVETGPTREVFGRPFHPYTVALLSAVPVIDPRSRRRRIVLEGEPPSPLSPQSGCAFHPRCPISTARCREEAPMLESMVPGWKVACHNAGKLDTLWG